MTIRLPLVTLYGLAADPRRTVRGIYWYLRGKRVRGANLIKAAAARNRFYYQLWIRVCEARDRRHATALRDNKQLLPLVAVISGADEFPEDARKTRQSVHAAFGGTAQIVHCGADSTFGNLASGSWILPLTAGDLINETTGARLADVLRTRPQARIVYWDEDQLNNGKRQSPWLKPDWDELLYLARDGLFGAAAYQIEPGTEHQWFDDCFAMSVKATAKAASKGAIVHLPHILSHCTSQSLRGRQYRAEAITRIWPDAPELTATPCSEDYTSLAWAETSWPSVAIIIPTRDRVELLRPCIESLHRLDYPGAVKIVVADNDSSDPATLRYLDELEQGGIAIIHAPGEFNFSRINNLAVDAVDSAFVCLLNNDIEALDGSWLRQMMVHASRPGVGAAGAMLLYPDGTIQHAGVAIGVGGAAGHVYRNLMPDDQGNNRMHATTRRVSAVTAACLLVRRAHYLAVGGLNERDFAVAFNDVDFCLRLGEMGLKNVFVAEARLLHHESKSRGDDMDAENIVRYRQELAVLQSRWQTQSAIDPWHSPLIRRSSEDFVLDLG